MKNTLFTLAIAIGSFIVGCSPSISITTDYDKSVDFKKYSTFGFLKWDAKSAELVNDIDQRRLQDAIAAQLESRGLKYQADGVASTMLGFHVIVETKQGTTAYTDHYGGMGYYGGWGYGYGYPYGGASQTTYSTYEYQVGTVIIDQYDAETKKLVWEGVAQGELKEDRKNREENIKNDVERMFADYPLAKVAAQ